MFPSPTATKRWERSPKQGTMPDGRVSMFSQKLEEALSLASTRHHGQTRKGSSVPYVTHLFHASMILARHGEAEDAMIAALLHDIVEDTCHSQNECLTLLEHIEQRFGTAVKEAIITLSEPKRNQKGATLSWKERKMRYLSQLEAGSQLALVVSAADKIHNLSTLLEDLATRGDVVWRMFTGTQDESLWFYERVADVLRDRLHNKVLMGELSDLVEQLRTRLSIPDLSKSKNSVDKNPPD